MTRLPPPRLAIYLLQRFTDNEPLAGDLLEEFGRRQSRLWLWAQVTGALILAVRRRPRAIEVRPLHLVDERLTPLRIVGQNSLRPIVNLTASPMRGTGGPLGIASLLLLSTAMEPSMWGLVVLGLVAGIVVGCARISRARRHGLAHTGGENHVFTGR